MRAKRLAQGWTQVDLSFHSRVPVSEISRIENGRTKPYPGHAASLCRVLGLEIDELQQPVDLEGVTA
jgi:transcriptional regulator with XRE-family HTH domain